MQESDREYANRTRRTTHSGDRDDDSSENPQPGQTLPSAKALAERFEVTVPTVREALRRLEAAGSVELKHGSGTYVREAINRRILDNPHYVPVDLAAAIELLEAIKTAVLADWQSEGEDDAIGNADQTAASAGEQR